MNAAIELTKVGKRYQQLDEEASFVRSLLPFRNEVHHDLWALRDVDLEVQEGETVGVVGANGAGKTTMLRLLAGVTRPTAGTVRVRGRIAPLISIGVGFHAEMSGRENAVINGMMLGLTSDQVLTRLDEIVEFAGLGDFIDTPVKFYSSGMAMRLGFSVIMHTEPQVLLIDEILAVGDSGFLFRCFDRLREFQAAGTTIVMVSHSMHALRQLCRRGLLIRDGAIEYDGNIERAIGLHCATLSSDDDPSTPRTFVDIVERRLVGAEGEDHHASYDAPIRLELMLRFLQEVRECTVEFRVMAADGWLAASNTSVIDREHRPFEVGEEATLTIAFRARLGGGNYELGVRIYGADGELLAASEGLIFFVTGRPGSLGVIDLRASIGVDGVDRTDLRDSLL